MNIFNVGLESWNIIYVKLNWVAVIILDEIRKFEKIYRYYPYYTEGCLNT